MYEQRSLGILFERAQSTTPDERKSDKYLGGQNYDNQDPHSQIKREHPAPGAAGLSGSDNGFRFARPGARWPLALDNTTTRRNVAGTAEQGERPDQNCSRFH